MDNPQLPCLWIRLLASHGQAKLVARDDEGPLLMSLTVGPPLRLRLFLFFFQPPDLASHPSSMAIVTFSTSLSKTPDLAINGQTRSSIMSLIHGRRQRQATSEGAARSGSSARSGAMTTSDDSSLGHGRGTPTKVTRVMEEGCQ